MSTTTITYDKLLTDVERESLSRTLEQHKGERDSILIRLTLLTGAREVEIVGDPRKDIVGVRLCDLHDGPRSVTIHAAKRSLDRDIPLPAAFYAELKAYALRLPFMDAQSRLFPMTTRRFQQIWRNWAPGSASGKGLHALRHTAASLFYANTHDLLATAAFLGHKSIRNTQTYVAFEAARQRRAAMKGMWGLKLDGGSGNKTD